MNQDEEASDFYEALAEYEGDDIGLRIDTIISTDLKSKLPFVFRINAEGTVENGISFVNDSILSITLDDLIQHIQIESETDSPDLNFYLDYSYSDLSILIIKFPCNIELMSSESFTQETQNNYGKYSFSLEIVNNNQLNIQST